MASDALPGLIEVMKHPCANQKSEVLPHLGGGGGGGVKWHFEV